MTLTIDRRRNHPSFVETITNTIDAIRRTEPPFAAIYSSEDDLADRRGAVIDIEQYFQKDWSQYATIDEAFPG